MEGDKLIGVLEILDELRDIYKKIHDERRSQAYSVAAKSLRRQPNIPLEKIRDLDGIGKGIADKIVEFVNTGKVKKLEELRKDPIVIAWKVFGGIMNATPEIWIAAGARTIKDLSRLAALGKIKLTSTQQLGIRYYSDINTRIPRAEVKEIGEDICVRAAATGAISSCEIVGSYRRLAKTSGDVDVLISGWNETFLLDFKKAIVADCIIVSAGKERLTLLYGGKHRQVDILYVRPDEYYAALNYFTGPAEHNIRMRGLAKARGLRLNQHGLYRDDVRIPLASESEIYKICGVEYLSPDIR